MGFRGARGIDDVLQVSRRICEEVVGCRGEDRVVVSLFDIEKAYPRVCRDALWWLMAHFGADARFIRVCRALHEHTAVSVRVHGGQSSLYTTDRGLREWCPSSPPLFNVYHHAVMMVFRHRRADAAESSGMTPGLPWTVRVNGKLKKRPKERAALGVDMLDVVQTVIGDFGFADDTGLVATAQEAPQAERIWIETMRDCEQRHNHSKTEKLMLASGGRSRMEVMHEGEVENARHVGARLQDDANTGEETKERVSALRAKVVVVATAWCWGTKRRRKPGEHLSLCTRAQVMRAVTEPCIMVFCKTRKWSTANVAALRKIQNYAIRRVFQVTIPMMELYHISHERMRQAVGWPTVNALVRRATLMWLGHVARMGCGRLPKRALFGWWTGHEARSGSVATQLLWLSKVLRDAGVPEMDWFRLAQAEGKSGRWQQLIDRVYPRAKVSAEHKRKLNLWRLGEPLPEMPRRRVRARVSAMPPGPLPSEKAERAARRVLGVGTGATFPCPACSQEFARGVQRSHHYLEHHAVTDAAVTTFTEYSCAECGDTFRCRSHRRSHMCKANAPRPRREGEEPDGSLPLRLPQMDGELQRWVLFTDGSGVEGKAGWGVAVYANEVAYHRDALFALSGPVITEPRHHLFQGAVGATNNTAEVTGLIEALLWLRDEAPGPPEAPAVIWYDSDYAAGIVLRRLLPQANLALAERAVMLYGLVSGRRPVELRWVKGHSYERGVGVVDPCVSWGNHVADWLADRGLTGSVGNHSRRWTAPQPWRNDREDWQVERCRTCNKSFGFSAHRAGSHEVFLHCGAVAGSRVYGVPQVSSAGGQRC